MPKKLPTKPIGAMGWCSNCFRRFNRRSYRFLADGKNCETCLARYPSLQPPPQPEAIELVEPVKPERKRKNLVSPKIGNYKRVNYFENLAKEEELLVQAFEELKPKLGQYWIKPVASFLGWTDERTSVVSRRLRKKGVILEPEPIENQLLAKIKNSKKSLSCYELASEFEFVDAPWISQILKNMVKDGKISVIRDTNPFLYYIEHETSNC